MLCRVIKQNKYCILDKCEKLTATSMRSVSVVRSDVINYIIKYNIISRVKMLMKIIRTVKLIIY